MPKKTLALIAGLVLVTVILFIIALQTGKNQVSPAMKQENTGMVSPTISTKRTTLSLSPNPLNVVSGKTVSVDVVINNSGDPITGMELDLMYDPTVLTDVKVTNTKLFANGLVLFSKNTPATGKYVYSFAIQPGQKPITASGVVATITFSARGVLGKQSQIFIDQTSLVTAQGITTSVLKDTKGTTIVIVPAGSPTTAPKQTTATPATTTVSPKPSVMIQNNVTIPTAAPTAHPTP